MTCLNRHLTVLTIKEGAPCRQQYINLMNTRKDKKEGTELLTQPELSFLRTLITFSGKTHTPSSTFFPILGSRKAGGVITMEYCRKAHRICKEAMGCAYIFCTQSNKLCLNVFSFMAKIRQSPAVFPCLMT